MNVVVRNIERIIREKGFLKKGVAKRAGLTEQQFCDMLKGRKVIKAEHVPGLSMALEVQPSELFIDNDKVEGN